MTSSQVPPVGADPAWAAAEAVASRHRNARLNRIYRRRYLDRVLGPIVAAVWLVSVVAAVIGLLTPGDLGYEFGFVSFGALVLFAVFGGWWMASTGRFVLLGSSGSIRAALPQAAQRSVRRQLALREPLDREHPAVVLELAHQNRQLLGGQVVLFAFYPPLYLNIAQNLPGWVGAAFLLFGAGAFIVGGVFLLVAHRRFTQLIREHEDATRSTDAFPTRG